MIPANSSKELCSRGSLSLLTEYDYNNATKINYMLNYCALGGQNPRGLRIGCEGLTRLSSTMGAIELGSKLATNGSGCGTLKLGYGRIPFRLRAHHWFDGLCRFDLRIRRRSVRGGNADVNYRSKADDNALGLLPKPRHKFPTPVRSQVDWVESA